MPVGLLYIYFVYIYIYIYVCVSMCVYYVSTYNESTFMHS